MVEKLGNVDGGMGVCAQAHAENCRHAIKKPGNTRGRIRLADVDGGYDVLLHNTLFIHAVNDIICHMHQQTIEIPTPL